MEKQIKIEEIGNEQVLFKLDQNDTWQVVHSGTIEEVAELELAFLKIGFNCIN